MGQCKHCGARLDKSRVCKYCGGMHATITVDYNGKYPNLCSGVLRVEVSGIWYNFGQHVLHSGGSVSFDEDWCEHVAHGDWTIDDEDWPINFPMELREATLEEINSVIPHGCCGGCV